MYQDAVEELEKVVTLAKKCRRLERLLDDVRIPYENTEQTIARLKKERLVVFDMLGTIENYNFSKLADVGNELRIVLAQHGLLEDE